MTKIESTPNETKTLIDVPPTSPSEKSDSSNTRCRCIKHCGRTYRHYISLTDSDKRIFNYFMMLLSIYSIPLYWGIPNINELTNPDQQMAYIFVCGMAGILTSAGCIGLVSTIYHCYKASIHTDHTILV